MLSYEELYRLYLDCQRENKELKAELARLRTPGEVATPPTAFSPETPDSAQISKYSSPDEKISLFRSLFRGREDVFARRWQSASGIKSGYQPVCRNEWTAGLCDKKTVRCATCPNRVLLPLSDRDFYNHLKGNDQLCRDVIGIYPLLSDETCYFLCADFDEESFQDDVTAYREVCKQFGLEVAVERSRSGKGAHAWLFFEQPVPASLARTLGSGILTRAMELRSELSFQSYDRLFPNQDTMPEGGFGNLVALPLQGQARKNGNSLFVDEAFLPYADQWSYLSCIKKVSVNTVEETVAGFGQTGELGNLVSLSDEKPWESRRKSTVSRSDFPLLLQIVRANMLYIPLSGLSSKARNQIKRLAAFGNPDFYRAQAMRFPTHNKPRIICTAEIGTHYIAIPRGCEKPLLKLLEEEGIAYTVEDQTNPGIPIPVSFYGSLRDDQQPAADALLKHRIGVLSATTAFGKTVIASYLIGQRKVNTLILVHTQALMMQWKSALERFLSFESEIPEPTKPRGRKQKQSPIGILGAGKHTLHGAVDVALMQSLVTNDEVKEAVRGYGMIIADECHHVSAVNFEAVLRYANARYVYGLTATPSRQDGHHPIIFMQCGAIRYRVSAREQAEKRAFDHVLIPAFTPFRCPPASRPSIAELYQKLSENETRNRQIIADVLAAVDAGRTPIILSERREHVQRLAEALSSCPAHLIVLTGSASARERKESLEELTAIPESEPLIVVATGKYVGEGFDFPRLDTLFLTLPIAWKGKVAQYAGRLHRDYHSKSEVQIYDYADIHVPVLEKMYQKRLKSYASIGYKVRIAPTVPESIPDLIYDGKNYDSVFCNDLKNARREILIASPSMWKGRLKQLLKILSSLAVNQIPVTVVTHPPEDFEGKRRSETEECLSELKQYQIRVMQKSGFYQKFAMIDQETVWYGSVNFLGFNSAEESVMRLKNAEIAEQLIDLI